MRISDWSSDVCSSDLVELLDLTGVVARAGAGGDDLALGRLLLGVVRNDDTTGGLRLGLDGLDHDPVVQRAELHGCLRVGWPRPLTAAGGGALALTLNECQRVWNLLALLSIARRSSGANPQRR